MQRTDAVEIPRPSTRTTVVEAQILRPSVSIVMPVYNLGASIQNLVDLALARFGELLPSFELVVVDDGSIDGTLASACTIKDRRVRVVGYSQNRGKGEALLYGLRFAMGDTIILADGDLQAVPIDLDHYLKATQTADIAIASKRVSGAKLEAGFKRKFLSIGFNAFVRVLLSLPVSDTQAGFKIFRREAIRKIVPLICVKHYAFDVELLTVANLLKLNIVELPAYIKLESNFRNKNIIRMFIDVLGIAYRLRIRHWYQRNLELKKRGYQPIIRW
ncbi:MAG: glycosyltransferase [Thaumarchaeota archaeon]|nr:glycosyltransferase [Nitrososphaerota archaeon]